jgi:transposase
MSLASTRDLTDFQWEALDDLIPEPPRREDGRGRPWKDRRAVLNAILWVLRTGAPWAEVTIRRRRDYDRGNNQECPGGGRRQAVIV